MKRRQRWTGTTAAATAVLLLFAAPSPAFSWGVLQSAGSATDPTAPLVAALALTAQALTGWLLAVGALAGLSRLPGRAGRFAVSLGRRLAPATVRRAVEIGLGLAVAVGVVGTVGGTAAASPAGPAATHSSLDWPAGPAAPDSNLDWPAHDHPAPAATRPASRTAPGDAVVVRPGDTLWGIAAGELREAGSGEPAATQVATRWPTWWSANRQTIGDDPDLLHPGTPLTRPTTPPLPS